MLDAATIDEVRRLCRLEALRASVFSVASESLDEHVPRVVVVVEISGETLAASIAYHDASGQLVSGGSL